MAIRLSLQALFILSRFFEDVFPSEDDNDDAITILFSEVLDDEDEAFVSEDDGDDAATAILFSELFFDGVFVSADDDDDDDDAIAVFLSKVLDDGALSKTLTEVRFVPAGATYTWNHSEQNGIGIFRYPFI